MSTHHVRAIPVTRVGQQLTFDVPLRGAFDARTPVGPCAITWSDGAFRALEVPDDLVLPDVAEAALTVTSSVRLDLVDAAVGQWWTSPDGRLAVGMEGVGMEVVGMEVVGMEGATRRVVAFTARR